MGFKRMKICGVFNAKSCRKLQRRDLPLAIKLDIAFVLKIYNLILTLKKIKTTNMLNSVLLTQ